MEQDMRIEAKYREVVQRLVFQGRADARAYTALKTIVKIHPSFIFELHHFDASEVGLDGAGVEIRARPERVPAKIDADFIEAVQDKLAEMREEFTFALAVLS